MRANADDENVGKSAEKAKKQFAGGEIMGKTLGVIGLGAIGAKVAQAAEALGMKVIGYDPAMDGITVHEKVSPTVEFVDDLAKLYPVCDFVTIHVPALPATKMMINGEALAQMKDGVVFLNFSRDVLVDDGAMAAALESGKVAAYVTDFAKPAGEDGARHRHPAPGRVHRRGRGQLRQDGRGGSHGLPGARREDPLREYVGSGILSCDGGRCGELPLAC